MEATATKQPQDDSPGLAALPPLAAMPEPPVAVGPEPDAAPIAPAPLGTFPLVLGHLFALLVLAVATTLLATHNLTSGQWVQTTALLAAVVVVPVLVRGPLRAGW